MDTELSGMAAWDDVVWPSEDNVPIYIYRRLMPHWRLEGAICFATFRLADSIPRSVVEAWAEERKTWLSGRGVPPDLPEEEQRRRYLAIPEALRRPFERDALRKFFDELDRCRGACVLRNPEAASIVAEALRYHDGIRLRCGDFVVMPNHVHWLLLPLPGHTLESILQSVKGWSASRVNKLAGRTGRLWQRESFDHLVRSPEQLERVRGYIAQNPSRARLKPGEFFHYEAK